MKPASLPLAGITILDLSRVLACPFASMILAELGANVIKIEQPGEGDETRSFEPFIERRADGAEQAPSPESNAAPPPQESAYYMAFNRSKRSITVNLRTPEGQQLIRDLAAKADVLVENFPVGTFKRYGLDYAAIKAVNQRIVYVSCTGFGQTGPYAKRKGYDTVFQAMSGLMSLTGERGGGPVKPGLPVADLSSGLWVAIGILSALQGRNSTGKGCQIDFSMLDGQVGLLSLAAARYFALGEVAPRLGTEHPGRVPSATFQCADGKWLHITCSDQHWMPLVKVLKLEAWGSEPALQDNSVRVARRKEVMAQLTAAIATWNRDELGKAFDDAQVPAGPINHVDEVFSDPHVIARGMRATFEHPAVGEFDCVPLPYKFDGWDDPQPSRPPLLGEHTDTLLTEMLGKSAADIAALRAAKAI